MAAKGGGESKTGLVVALVLFILLSLILGVTTYTGYDAVNAAKTEKDKAVQEKNEKDKLADWYRAQALTYRSYMGRLPKDEKGDVDKNAINDLKVLRERHAAGQNAHSADPQAKGNAALMADLDKRYGWDLNKTAPQKTMEEEIEQLKRQLKEAMDSASKTKEEADGLNTRVAALSRELKAANDKYQEELGKARKEAVDSRSKDLALIKSLQDELDKKSQDYGAELKKKEADVGRLQAIVDDATKLITALRKSSGEQAFAFRQEFSTDLKKLETDLEKLAAVKLPKLEERVAKVDRLKDIEPKGTIYRVDGSGEMPFLDLGTSHGLKPGQTFSIHGKGPDGRPLADAKGSVEVIKVIGPRLSQGRVTALADAGRDPIMPGDLLVNPTWKPNQKMHIAIAGVIDLTGDGRDSRDEFVRTLEAQNVKVVAYLDLKELKVVGQMDARTDYLVVGYSPDDTALARREGESRAERADKARVAMTTMQEQATKDGVQTIRLKDFLALTGYRTPRQLSAEPTTTLPRPPAPGLPAPPERRDIPKLDREGR